MNMTHYMELLATNQPWNLLIFMAVPIVLAETMAISELYVLFTRSETGPVRSINRWSGILVGTYFLGVFVYLTVNVAIPLTAGGGWRGWIDVVAVGFYLFGIVPLGGVALLDLSALLGGESPNRMKLHAILVGLFLVTGHVSMIAGMLEPALGQAPVPAHSHKM
jgi:hypothetical protein